MDLHHFRIALASALILAGTSFTAAQTTTTEPTTTTTPVTSDDNDFDWGLIGLLGLIGLAGLTGRDRCGVDGTTRTGTTVR